MRLSFVIILFLLLTACTVHEQKLITPAQAVLTENSSTSHNLSEHIEQNISKTIDLTHLPLGGKISTSPQKGAIYLCNVPKGGGGAQLDGPWIHNNTYDLTAKPSVSGHVDWPSNFTITLQGDQRIVTGNDLPSHPTGTYPVSPNDPAYQYDRNPNSIVAQHFELKLPANPTLAATPSCIGGEVGVLLSGSALFNGLDAEQRDAVAHEVQDSCQGHPEKTGTYHYHSLTSCFNDSTTGHSPLVGYALDGFGIYGRHGENGENLTSDDLDECHGHTHVIEWDGKNVTMYHYHATWDYPYTAGCLRGTPVARQVVQTVDQKQSPAQVGSPPDLAAAAAKLGISEEKLKQALGPPPPDLAVTATKLGISEQTLKDALGR